jgi:hypothetical protein
MQGDGSRGFREELGYIVLLKEFVSCSCICYSFVISRDVVVIQTAGNQ